MRTDRAMASMAVNELGPMLTASEVAELLHLHVNTVKRLGDRGELPFFLTSAGPSPQAVCG